MKFLIINTDYPEVLRWLYAQHPGLEWRSYQEQMQARNDCLFGVADFYSRNLRALGHEAWEVHANNEFLQAAWAQEHGRRDLSSPARRWTASLLEQARRVVRGTPLRRLRPLFRPLARRLDPSPTRIQALLAEQIKALRPDVLLNQDVGAIAPDFLREMKAHARLIVGQIASPLPAREDYRGYDLMISSLPNFVEYFRQRGLAAALNRLAFDPSVRVRVPAEDRTIPVSFVGSLSPAHQGRLEILEHLCRRVDLAIWGQGIDRLPASSPIRAAYRGPAWGIDMYRVLARSRITLNHHLDLAGAFANNSRLFEATGMGALLMTDWKQNLGDLFELEKEVAAYRGAEECAERIAYYLGRPRDLETVARAGQERTRRDHTYLQRMRELVELMEPLL